MAHNNEDTNYAAKVGNSIIDYSTLDNYSARSIKYHNEVSDPVDENIIRGNTINQLIDQRIVNDYAISVGLVVSQEELVAYFNERILVAKSESALLSEINRLYGIDKTEYLEVLSNDLLRSKVQENVNQPLSEWIAEKKNSLEITINQIDQATE